jgi:hypothetical protein
MSMQQHEVVEQPAVNSPARQQPPLDDASYTEHIKDVEDLNEAELSGEESLWRLVQKDDTFVENRL